MSTALRVLLPFALALTPACTPPWDPLVGCAEVGACTTTGSSSDASISDGIQTVTGASGSDSSSTSSTAAGEGSSSSDGSGVTSEEAAPVEVEVFLSPSPVVGVGEVQVSVSTSRPIESVDIFDGDTPLVLGAAPDNPVHVFEVTSENTPGDGPHTIRAVAHASDGGSGEGEKELLIDVQPGGTEVWPAYVKTGPINGFTSAALLGNGVATAGFIETNQGLEAVAVRIDGTKGQPEDVPILLGPVAVTGGGRGPAIAIGDDEAAFVAWTRPDNGSTRWALSRVRFGEPKGPTWSGPSGTSVHAIAVVGDVVILVGAVEMGPGTHDLAIWWVSAENGQILLPQTFAAPFEEDNFNTRDEVAHGVVLIDDELVVVGERDTTSDDNQAVRRTVVLRYLLAGDFIAEWTSPGELMDEDGAMAVTPLRAGGFVVTGWGRDKGISQRLLLTRWFSREGEPGLPRIEPGTTDAIGFAVGEDREGKIIIAGALQQPKTDANAWVFAVPGPVGAPVWEVIRNGPGQGPDEAAGLAIDAWGYSYITGSEFDALQPRAFALRLYP